ncbi:hypothetical protein NEMBOFW57_008026 [Staphylotrichum longicolle]|uniref:Uncharacterized protein n=1 Tax=Staphylotrichum longicolle TaxID=669026 RepID=A0AAD4EQL1_9PEZI|nr:hypothetical protein NEMBOFW57_008026 [Staphylotrichum longicolle]
MEKKAKRTVDYPEWLASTYSPERVSSACQCLSIPAASEATFTATATAEAVTLTDDATITETITNTVTTDIGVVTQTVWTTVVPTPTPSAVPQRAIISVHHKGTGALVGYVYMSSGPAITTDRTLAAVVKFDMPAGATGARRLRLQVEGDSPSALSFHCPVSLELQNYYGSMTLDGNPTPPGSRPVPAASFAYETDIWSVSTETKMLGWEWIANDGAVYSSLSLFRVGGRMYPVGNLVTFNTAFAGVSAVNKYEIALKYQLV